MSKLLQVQPMVVALIHPNSTASSTPAVLLMLAEINFYLSLSFFFDKKSNHTVIYSLVSPRAVQIITPRPARGLALAAQAANRFETQPNQSRSAHCIIPARCLDNVPTKVTTG
jgi:hypothetical protein